MRRHFQERYLKHKTFTFRAVAGSATAEDVDFTVVKKFTMDLVMFGASIGPSEMGEAVGSYSTAKK